MKKRTFLRSFAAMPLAFPLMSSARKTAAPGDPFTASTRIGDVAGDPAFRGFGRLLFPLDNRYWSGTTLGDISLVWYSEMRAANTVAVFNFLKKEAQSGIRVFTPLYAADEVRSDPEKAETGLFFFKGSPGAPFAVICAGGGFQYVGALHDSFPHALALARKGINAFAVIYRPDPYKACEDLSRALAVIFENASEFEASTGNYSLWGGSAGARMAAWVGRYGTEQFGEKPLPRPAAVVMEYTGLDDAAPEDPPTFACVGSEDAIASPYVMRRRMERLKALGIPTEFHEYPGLRHGFGIGTGTSADGWVDKAVDFWMKAAAAREQRP